MLLSHTVEIEWIVQGPHCPGKTRKTGKQGNWKYCSSTGKHREFCQITGKAQGILCASVLNSLIEKIKDIVIFAAIFPSFFFIRTECVSFPYETSPNH